ncbi:MAG TPA: helix-turn-helix domain-containing protein [Bacillota bacterium]|nr:helix-turn-helix domain-containing protein [Bacillota bacterium]
MYVTVSELAQYLSMDESQVASLVLQGRIRAVHDGNEYMVNKGQFTGHVGALKRYRESDSHPDHSGY